MSDMTEPTYVSECHGVDVYVERIWKESGLGKYYLGWEFVTKCSKCHKPTEVKEAE